MTGVSVTESLPPSQVDQDLASAYQGGTTFMVRLQQLSDGKGEYDRAKLRHDAALAALNLGMDAKSAYADAAQKQARLKRYAGRRNGSSARNKPRPRTLWRKPKPRPPLL
jgi:hypothetical protein